MERAVVDDSPPTPALAIARRGLSGPLDTDGERLSFDCPECAAERVPASCPDCGADAMGLTLDEENAVVIACERCGAEFETPAYRE